MNTQRSLAALCALALSGAAARAAAPRSVQPRSVDLRAVSLSRHGAGANHDTKYFTKYFAYGVAMPTPESSHSPAGLSTAFLSTALVADGALAGDAPAVEPAVQPLLSAAIWPRASRAVRIAPALLHPISIVLPGRVSRPHFGAPHISSKIAVRSLSDAVAHRRAKAPTRLRPTFTARRISRRAAASAPKTTRRLKPRTVTARSNASKSVVARSATPARAPRRTLVAQAVAQLPPATQVPPMMPVDVNGKAANARVPSNNTLPQATGVMRKIITVSALKLPPVSQPLPESMRSRTVSADAAFITLSPSVPRAGVAPDHRRLARGGNRQSARIAQNPDAPAVRQPESPVTNSDRLPNQIEVAVSTFVVLLTTTDLQTVAIADPAIADVAVVNARSVLVNGKSPGVTSLVIVDRLKIRQYQVRVTSAPGTRPADIAANIGLSGVNVRQVRDALVLEGEVNTAEEARRAVEVATAYSPKVINQLTVRDVQGSEAGMGAQIQSTIDIPGVRVRLVGDTAFLDGTVENQAQYQRAEIIAKALAKNVVNLLRLPALTVEQLRESIGALSGVAAGAVGTEAGAPNAAAFAPPPFTARQVGDQIILEGTLPSQQQLEQALATANRTGLQVINRLQLAPAISEQSLLLNVIEAAIGRPGVRVRGTPQRLVLEGVVPDTNAAVAAEQIARAYSRDVDNMLSTPNPLLVNVDVSIVEINSNNARNLGVQLGAATLLSDSVTLGATIQGAFGLGEDATGSFRNLNPLRARLDALYATGVARLLSNPRTTVLSGRTATFQVGGQVPIPALTNVGANGATTGIVFKDFGILVDVIPNASTSGAITMRVRTEVSAPDFANGVTPPGGGSPIPGFSRRSTVTEVTVQPNGTLALSGLIRNDITKDVSRVPFLSRIPIIGALFQSKRFVRSESELVVFVTPRLLPNPLAPGTTAPAAPFASGNTTNIGTVMGNPGIPSFNTGATFNNAGGGAPGGAGGAQ